MSSGEYRESSYGKWSKGKRRCDPLMGSLLICIGVQIYQNCPDSIWVDNKECKDRP